MPIGAYWLLMKNEKPKKTIFLTGPMGSGKTTLAKIISEKYGPSCIDLDKLIEEKSQKNISQIFIEDGEQAFRSMEYETLKEILEKQEFDLISLGGGTLENRDLLDQIKINGTLVYLKTSMKTLLKRLSNNIQNRPLLKDSENLFKKREHSYNQANITINTTKLSPLETAQKIYEYFKDQ